ncbi:Hypothetical predicted protein [Paramuricea clavata]|uniref:Uncharacterized protein n=1 Tax=Paramuricea clavata TaxID=317549 RepID=A0A6S7J472_PARCT|nr:Hypothetical predicted protein [Paramuricea clavata]
MDSDTSTVYTIHSSMKKGFRGVYTEQLTNKKIPINSVTGSVYGEDSLLINLTKCSKKAKGGINKPGKYSLKVAKKDCGNHQANSEVPVESRNHQANSEVPVESSRANSAPAPSPQILLASESSSRHIVFNTSVPGRPVVSAERVMRYGRHSGDSRLRTLQTSTRNKNRNIGPKSISLNDITLSGQKISATELNHGRTLNNAGGGTPNMTSSAANRDPTLLHATIISSSPDPNHSHIRVDV